ncbi:hypothetical protein PR003_g27519 [Phytophthora rubi]|uniref:Uncharacterized protein n=1 Tax=Phytophthora rubi TaxID=129364 RepID=A0A6A4BYW9_9STRA|nr:hypothetical protein PR002_g26532 [Phytophthora rubi]KAE8973430.1 hypothetical protein PR001_g26309 [Phytophthora rubi]KAE9282000.1 hypothetical protein PR003_g27519 [Phytophthora rubi]
MRRRRGGPAYASVFGWGRCDLVVLLVWVISSSARIATCHPQQKLVVDARSRC